MEQRLKERLTGAAILVALVVLIVPELFHGHIADRGSKAAASSEGPPLRSYTIDLGGTRATPMQLSPTAPRTAPLAAVPSSPAPLGPPASVSTAAAAGAAQHAGAGASGHTASAPRAPLARTHAAVIHAAAAHAAPSAAAPSIQWSVQLGLFAKRSNAERMVHAAEAKGFDASLSKPDAKGRYRVHVSGFTSRASALTLVARLRAAGLPAAAVAPK